MLKHAVKMDSVVKLRKLPMHAWVTGQRITKGWHTVDDQLITPSGFGTALFGGPL
jgi:hypothetical protein